ncbi:hypothetical protein KOEU_17990 [Komagataeibacter europaeus]|uniref:Uncharacterized protein n=1 Tax=Komagataeibacter europaeus TaxID=33995 RepID=A0A0M0EHS9_KOMEU|nr:hypothetical protein KOEU_32020 [Komagataeibacter europaeus]KON64829.1 hypothetical protein KOEU_17990 [Komagataeibacter europaeus]
MRSTARGFFQCPADRLRDFPVADRAWCPRPGFIVKPVQTVRCKTPAPLANRVDVRARQVTDRLVLMPIGCGKDNTGSPRKRLARLARPCQRFQFLTLQCRQFNRNRYTSHSITPAIRIII